MHLRTRVKGTRKTKLNVNRFGDNFTRRIREGVYKAGLTTDRVAKTRCPVDTGRLRSSIQLDMSTDGLTARVSTNVEYAPHVEYGTRTQRAQPFFRPGVRAGIEELNQSLR